MTQDTSDFSYDTVDSNNPVHDAFGLSYSAYFCVPRIVLEAMPVEWQKKFVGLMTLLPVTPSYDCYRRDKRGRFIKDPLVAYRRGLLRELAPEMQAHIDRF